MQFLKFGNKIKSNIVSINNKMKKEYINIENITKYMQIKEFEIINKYKSEVK